jgi:hypothetical protein
VRPNEASVGAAIGPGSFLVLVVNPDDLGRSSSLGVLDALMPVGRVLIALEREPYNTSTAVLTDVLSRYQLEVTQVEALEDERVSHAIIAHCLVDTSTTVGSQPALSGGRADLVRLLRAANKYYLRDLAGRRDLRPRQTSEAEVSEEAPDFNAADIAAAEAADQRTVRRLEAELRSAQKKINMLESSTSMRVGKALVQAANRPKESALRLPRQLLEMWRFRGQRRSAPSTSTAAGAGVTLRRPDRKFLSHGLVELDRRTELSIVGILRTETIETLTGYCSLAVTVPHDALTVFECVQPDLLLIEAATAEPGSPWAYFDDPSAADRGRRLHEMAVEAQDRGIPVVLWQNAAPHLAAAIRNVVDSADLVLSGPGGHRSAMSWHAGVNLAQHVPAGLADSERSGFVYLGDSPSGSLFHDRDLLEEVLRVAAPSGLPPNGERAAWTGTTHRHWERRRTANQSAIVGIACPFSVPPYVNGLYPQILEQLAAGLRIVSGPNQDLLDTFGDSAISVVDKNAVEAQIEKVLAEGQTSPMERWRTLRVLLEKYSTPMQLDRLARRLGLRTMPSARRAVTVIVDVTAETAPRMLESIMAQNLRPAEVVANLQSEEFVLDRIGTELESAGIAVTVVPGQRGPGELIRYAKSPWMTFWDGGPWSADRLLDLVLAAECSEADAVGFADAGFLQFVQSLPPRGTLLRADAAAVEGVEDLDTWARRGRRLSTVGLLDGRN